VGNRCSAVVWTAGRGTAARCTPFRWHCRQPFPASNETNLGQGELQRGPLDRSAAARLIDLAAQVQQQQVWRRRELDNRFAYQQLALVLDSHALDLDIYALWGLRPRITRGQRHLIVDFGED